MRERWILGGYCQETRQGFLTFVPRRDARTLLPIVAENVAHGSRGACTYDTAKFSGFLTLSHPPCLHFGPITSTKFPQPPLLHLLLGYPLSPPTADIICTCPRRKINFPRARSDNRIFVRKSEILLKSILCSCQDNGIGGELNIVDDRRS